MTANDISGNFSALREVANAIVGADLQDSEKQVAKTAVETSLRLLECLLLDINRIADAVEHLAKK